MIQDHLPPALRRHSLILAAALIAASTTVLATAPALAATTAGDVQVMQGALALEHEGIADYRLAGASGLPMLDTLKVALLFKGHHEQHRDALANLIREA